MDPGVKGEGQSEQGMSSYLCLMRSGSSEDAPGR